MRPLLQSIAGKLESWHFGLKRKYRSLAFPLQVTDPKMLNSDLFGKDCHMSLKMTLDYRASKR